MKPHLLFLAYYFPPAASSASVRAWNIAKHLSRLGWRVSVLTVDPKLLIRVDSLQSATEQAAKEGINMIYAGHSWRFLAPWLFRCQNTGWRRLLGGVARQLALRLRIEPEWGWGSHALRAATAVKEKDLSGILATGPPYFVWDVGRRAAKSLKRRFVLDYRDLWCGSPHDLSLRFSFATARAQRLERQLANAATALTCVSPSMASVLRDQLGAEHNISVITNGYDPEEVANVYPRRFDEFAIVYAGTFYPPKRVIAPVLEALASLIGERDFYGRHWRFHYFGDQSAHVTENAQRYGMLETITCHGRSSRAECLSALKGAAVGLVITTVQETNDPADLGIVTGKVFESISLAPATLIVAPTQSDVAQIFSNQSNITVIPGNRIEDLSEFFRHRLNVPVEPSEPDKRFSWTVLGRKFDEILRIAFSNDKRPSFH